MDNRQCRERALASIEENLKNDISIEDVAGAAGYSKYHFIGVFRDALHLTPADYIRKRRISEIVRRMEYEKRPISDIAFEYGFNSRENFVRAFKREHRILPTEFKYAQNSLKLYDRIHLDSENFDSDGKPVDVADFCPKVTLEKLGDFKLVVYKSDEETPPKFWNKYNVKNWSKKLSGGIPVEDFGVSAWNPVTQQLDYYIGIREENASGSRDGTITLDIKGGLYAIFDTPFTDHFHFVSTIHQTWDYIDNVWLPQNGYHRTGGYELESYVEESRKYSEKIYIPVEK